MPLFFKLLFTLRKFNQPVSVFCVAIIFTKVTVSLTSKQQLKFRLPLAFMLDKIESTFYTVFIFYVIQSIHNRLAEF